MYRIIRVRYLLVACLACSGSQPKLEPASYVEHMQKAERHEERAASHERAAASAEGALGNWAFECGDPMLDEQLRTGGQRLTSWQPCLDLEYEAARRHRRAAESELAQARRERRAAGELAEAERVACGGLSDDDTASGLFARRSAIRRVDALVDGDAVVGARVLLEAQRGMTAESLGRRIECTRARWALHGSDPQARPTDPTLVEGATVVVRDRGTHFEIDVRGATPEQGQIALARARGELVEQTATR